MKLTNRRKALTIATALALTTGAVITAAPAQAMPTFSGMVGPGQCPSHQSVGARGNFAMPFQMEARAITSTHVFPPNQAGTRTHYYPRSHRPVGNWMVRGQSTAWGAGTCGP